jgi:hypothetical protein
VVRWSNEGWDLHNKTYYQNLSPELTVLPRTCRDAQMVFMDLLRVKSGEESMRSLKQQQIHEIWNHLKDQL